MNLFNNIMIIPLIYMIMFYFPHFFFFKILNPKLLILIEFIRFLQYFENLNLSIACFLIRPKFEPSLLHF